MARIAGVDLPKGKPIKVALQYVYGVGPALSQKILASAEVSPEIKVKDLSEEQVSHLRGVIDKQYKVEGDLRREIQFNVKRLIDSGCYRGMRHRMSLPAHGQRTRTNARTRRGARRTVAGRGQRRGVAKK